MLGTDMIDFKSCSYPTKDRKRVNAKRALGNRQSCVCVSYMINFNYYLVSILIFFVSFFSLKKKAYVITVSCKNLQVSVAQ